MESVKDILSQAETAIAAASDPNQVQQLKAKYLGKKGELTEILKTLGKLSAEERPKVGQEVNLAKQEIHKFIETKTQELKRASLEQKLAAENIDVTLSGRGLAPGSLHPISQTIERITAILKQAGFVVAEGPELETEYYNFDALNIPDHHPARAMHDTFYAENGLLLRTHTSPVQIRAMAGEQPPFRVIAPGRVYRCDSDATHSPMFHQIEGLMIDKETSFRDLKGIIQQFLQAFFESDDLTFRFRPSYFPFTEPSAEVDIAFMDQPDGEEPEWLEVLGCGMVHPTVLRNVEVDPDIYSGYAFGLGVERLAMLRYGIRDIRTFYDNDPRFLAQF